MIMDEDPFRYVDAQEDDLDQTDRKLPIWAIVAVVLGTLFMVGCCGVFTASAFMGGEPTDPDTGTTSTATHVEVDGECRKRMLGSYRLVATVTVDNPTDSEVAGTVWVRWPAIGAEPMAFSQDITVPAGESVDFHVDEEIEGEQWLEMQTCEYGWNTTTW